MNDSAELSCYRSRVITGNRIKKRRSGLLALGALGVVFGDIGTSPLYAFTEVFAGAHDIPVVTDRVLGVLSLIFWTLTLIVGVKYVLVVMRADNEGEGGVMVLSSLARSLVRRQRGAIIIMVFGVLGAALFYGDGIITPAVSVLSAVEGLEVINPAFGSLVVPIAIALLVALFAVQRFGSGRMGSLFGPIMAIWFVIIGLLGLASVMQSPEVLQSISPTYAISFFVAEPLIAFLALGSVVLCVTGAEALYADMGQFGRFPIRISWFALAAPALYLNYLGQGALVLREPSAIENSFYLLVPELMRWPMIILATMATVIASQAVISGAFSMTQQAVRLGYLPRMVIRHTSATEQGQVYVPFINWTLCIAVIGLVLGFQDSSNLASAYGIAVTGTFVITTSLIIVVARHKWKVSWWILGPAGALFLVIDATFFAANLTKFDHGGWFPIAAAAVIFTMLMVWAWGSGRVTRLLADQAIPMNDLTTLLHQPDIIELPRTIVYVTTQDQIPLALTQRLHLYGVRHARTVVLRMVTADVPLVDDGDRLAVTLIDRHTLEAVLTYGFMEKPHPTADVRSLHSQFPWFNSDTCIYSFSSAVVYVNPRRHLSFIAAELFAILSRNAADPQRYFDLPPERVVEVRRLVRI